MLEKEGGLILDGGAQNVKPNLEKLLHNRGRFYFHHDLGIKATIKKDNYGHLVTVIPNNFKSLHHYVAFSKKVPVKVVQRVTKALEELNSDGELKRIYQKYVSLD